jgi:hypothetical protein
MGWGRGSKAGPNSGSSYQGPGPGASYQ